MSLDELLLQRMIASQVVEFEVPVMQYVSSFDPVSCNRCHSSGVLVRSRSGRVKVVFKTPWTLV